MNLFLEGIAWILDPVNWTGPGSIPIRIAQHLAISAVVLVIAAVIALPLGGVVGHTGRGKNLAVSVSGGTGATHQ
jgi:osmoprotectant transport system permease protein